MLYVKVGDIILTYSGNRVIRNIKRICKLKEDTIFGCVQDGVYMSDSYYSVYRPRKEYSKVEKNKFKEFILKNASLFKNVELISCAVNTIRQDTFLPTFKITDIKINKYYKNII